MPVDFTKYKSIDLAEEQSFIAYVKNSHPESVAFWSQWITDHPDQKDKVSEAEALIRGILVEEEQLSTTDVDALFNRIESSILKENKSKVKRLHWVRYAAAAAILLLAGFFLFMPSTDRTVSTKFAQQKEITLPDQSGVLLNADSKIAYAKKDWSDNRELDLQGEAFFSVEKGGKFKVNTSLGTVEVLGTSFNVLNRDGYFEVICITGKVNVTVDQLNQSEIIERYEGVFFNQQDNILVRKSISKEQDILWSEGQIHFEEKPLSFVFDEMERQFDINILEQAVQGSYTGTVNLSSLDSALYDICWPMKLNYDIKGRRVFITE